MWPATSQTLEDTQLAEDGVYAGACEEACATIDEISAQCNGWGSDGLPGDENPEEECTTQFHNVFYCF